MKIIQPVTAQIESDAPSDGYTVWSPVGRDFADDLVHPVLAAAQDTIYVSAYFGAAQIRAFRASTGDALPLPFSHDTSITALSASPDGAWLAVVDTDYAVSVYNVVTGALVFSDDCYRTGTYAKPVVWSDDSQVLAYQALRGSEVRPALVRVGTWTAVVTGDIWSMFREYPEGLDAGRGYTLMGLCAAADGAYYSISTYEGYQVDGPPTRAIRKSLIGRLALAGTNTFIERDRVEGISSSTSISTPSHLIYVPGKSHVLGTMDQGFYAFDSADFSHDPDVPNISLLVSEVALAPGGDELCIRASSVQPYYRRFNVSDYTAIGSFEVSGEPPVGRDTTIAYMPDYVAFVDPSAGFGLIDRSSGTRITQVNPTVSEGDFYTYRERNYLALSENNDRPDLGAAAITPTWLDLGVINPLRMTDGKVGSATVAPGVLNISVASETLIDGVALLGITATTVRVQVRGPSGALYDSGEQSLRDSSMITGWYDFFFSRRGLRRDFVVTDLPPYRGGTLSITLHNADGDVRVGELVVGRVRRIGDLLFGAKFGIDDWSKKERNEFGAFDVIERGFSKRGDYSVSILTSQLAFINSLLAGLRATPVVYIGSEQFEASVIYGYFRRFELDHQGPVHSLCRIEIEGLTDDSTAN